MSAADDKAQLDAPQPTQVEGYLKEAGQSRPDTTSKDILVGGLVSEDCVSGKDQQSNGITWEDDAAFQNLNGLPSTFAGEDQLFSHDVVEDNEAPEGAQLLFGLAGLDNYAGASFESGQLIDLGMSEALPPSEMIEDLARHYVETDELKGDGEHFITIAHAQTWVLITAYEARAMLYTRASMSAARGSRLVQMLALDRIDAPDDLLPPSLGPPIDWTELEERRRVFWIAFSNDAQGSIATGWNSIIRTEEIMTRLPASEAAFASGQEETAPFLDEVMKGAPYSGFTGFLVINEMLKSIMSHVHLIKSSDRPEDAINGAFWQRHRRLDNQLSTLFLFMPESFRLPENIRDPLATYINLNFHACVICLHHVALEKIETHQLDDSLRKECHSLLKNAAEEIASIAKLTSHRSSLFSNPLCAFSLYCATTVYVYLAKQDPSSGINSKDMSNLELIINVMEAISRIHLITSAFLQQACLDIDKNGLSSIIKLPNLYQYRDLFGGPASTAMSRLDITDCFKPSLGATSRNLEPRSTDNAHKRKRRPSASQLSAHRSVFDNTAEESFRSSDFSFSDDACGEMPPSASRQQLSVGFIPVRLSALPNSELRS
ncbi:hypothetical protein MKX07_000485 [Trichoderma sp. CBMAI-0711]|nr:hypothetical protein MKX07_000485 [Trichoderma sp. CBMAI-0711]